MTADDPLYKLQKLVNFFQELSAEEWYDFAAIWQPFTAKRKLILTAAGDTEKHLYYVLEGVQRAFYLKNDDKEATLVFSYAGSFSGVADSFLLQQPSKYYLETLTQSSFLRTTFLQLDELMNKHQRIERCIRMAVSYTLAGVLERQIELQCFSAEEKFRVLLKRSPHVLNLIPHKYLASYLGLDATTFSKLLGSVRL
ncbi:Crp/Fnr family transcriptional regulator [Segetibacter sp. 3557_3]|uniref:Crp/Fnr family transcriptional regulator n=1 Tax=Segetibacter sp. 3557_3 TaxID=2547429 RepID=UPI0010589CA5|nr:Crp/Fnr family transcriptional regulator [Segetibacter sp. 3557_3]TDH25536.1 Crp/Fnr family transcriptional regulator [Segetibacter sp. 3557_3]